MLRQLQEGQRGRPHGRVPGLHHRQEVHRGEGRLRPEAAGARGRVRHLRLLAGDAGGLHQVSQGERGGVGANEQNIQYVFISGFLL